MPRRCGWRGWCGQRCQRGSLPAALFFRGWGQGRRVWEAVRQHFRSRQCPLRLAASNQHPAAPALTAFGVCRFPVAALARGAGVGVGAGLAPRGARRAAAGGGIRVLASWAGRACLVSSLCLRAGPLGRSHGFPGRNAQRLCRRQQAVGSLHPAAHRRLCLTGRRWPRRRCSRTRACQCRPCCVSGGLIRDCCGSGVRQGVTFSAPIQPTAQEVPIPRALKRATTPSQRRRRRLCIGSNETITTRAATQGQRMCVLLFRILFIVMGTYYKSKNKQGS